MIFDKAALASNGTPVLILPVRKYLLLREPISRATWIRQPNLRARAASDCPEPLNERQAQARANPRDLALKSFEGGGMLLGFKKVTLDSF